jgi:hypothetical protein
VLAGGGNGGEQFGGRRCRLRIGDFNGEGNLDLATVDTSFGNHTIDVVVQTGN